MKETRFQVPDGWHKVGFSARKNHYVYIENRKIIAALEAPLGWSSSMAPTHSEYEHFIKHETKYLKLAMYALPIAEAKVYLDDIYELDI